MARPNAATTRHRPAPLDPELVSQICALYATGLSTRRISTEVPVPRRTVTAALRAAGVEVAARGAGRPRPTRVAPPEPTLRDDLLELYVTERLTRAQVAAKLGVPENRVRAWLRDLNVAMRTRGRGAREDRHRLTAAPLSQLYVNAEMTADQVAMRLRSSRREVLASAHEHGIPVRPGGATDNTRALRLLSALYDDTQVVAVLQRHHIPLVRRSGSVTNRFPTPSPLTAPLLCELYVDCGMSTTQIELVTGQPAATVQRQVRAAGIPLRPPGGLAPFTRRARTRPNSPKP